jgi:hypothetical protein
MKEQKRLAGHSDLDAAYRASGLVVRPRGRHISTVKVRVGVSHNFVVEGNCVAARRGEKQPETNGRSAGNELDSAVRYDEPSAKWRSLKLTGHATVVVKAMVGCVLWLEVERSEGMAQ